MSKNEENSFPCFIVPNCEAFPGGQVGLEGGQMTCGAVVTDRNGALAKEYQHKSAPEYSVWK